MSNLPHSSIERISISPNSSQLEMPNRLQRMTVLEGQRQEVMLHRLWQIRTKYMWRLCFLVTLAVMISGVIVIFFRQIIIWVGWVSLMTCFIAIGQYRDYSREVKRLLSPDSNLHDEHPSHTSSVDPAENPDLLEPPPPTYTAATLTPPAYINPPKPDERVSFSFPPVDSDWADLRRNGAYPTNLPSIEFSESQVESIPLSSNSPVLRPRSHSSSSFSDRSSNPAADRHSRSSILSLATASMVTAIEGDFPEEQHSLNTSHQRPSSPPPPLPKSEQENRN